MTKRITITAGDYVLLSDIPNEQVFTLVKECFGNAGFNDCNGLYANWHEKHYYLALGALDFRKMRFIDYFDKRKLSLSDVFNSTNGGFNWGTHTSPIRKVTANGIKYVHALCGAEMVTLDKLFDYEEISDTYKISRLCNLNYLERTDVKLIEGRATGKSTAHHLELISKAMKSPEQWVKVYSDYDNLERHNRWAFEEVRNLCHKLGLDWMEFSVSGNSIRYMPYQTVKMVTKWEVIA